MSEWRPDSIDDGDRGVFDAHHQPICGSCGVTGSAGADGDDVVCVNEDCAGFDEVIAP